MDYVKYGDYVSVETAAGKLLSRRALTGVIMGDDFEVVWACRGEEWETAAAEGRTPRGCPWPADDVTLRDNALEDARIPSGPVAQ